MISRKCLRVISILVLLLFIEFNLNVAVNVHYSSLREIFSRLNVTSNEPLTTTSCKDPDCNRTTLEVITAKGYPAESHKVVTEDGYILGIHRIPAPQYQQPRSYEKRPVVLLQHGLMGCSFNWVSNLENQSLGFILADAGFDVWLSNSRGNMYSIGHTWLNTKSKKYWQFSWDEMAKYDLPAVVDYILEKTNQHQLYYVGHSQGTLIGFAKFSSDLEFAKKIKTFFALAPVSRVGHADLGENSLAPYVKELQILFNDWGYYNFLPGDGLAHELATFVCDKQVLRNNLCKNLYLAWFGTDVDRLNQTRLPVLMSHCPAGTSTQNIAHFAQMKNSGQFQMYDYTLRDNGKENLIKYGQKTPPINDPSPLNVPTVLFHSDADVKADPIDVAWLISQINNTIVGNYHYTDYSHMDFIWATSAVDDVYNHIVDHILQKESLLFFHY